jgi:hypothetical protein
MTLNIDNTLVSTDIQTFQNTAILNQPFAVAGGGGSNGNGFVLTFTIPTGANVQRLSQVKANFSFDAAKWYILPMMRAAKIAPSGTVYFQVFANYSGTNLIVSINVIPTAATFSYPAFTLNVNAKVFITPT